MLEKVKGFFKDTRASANPIIDKAIGVLFIAYIGILSVRELLNASAPLTGVVGTLGTIVLPIIIMVAFVQVVRGRN